MARPPALERHKRRVLISALAISGLGLWAVVAVDSTPSPDSQAMRRWHDRAHAALRRFEERFRDRLLQGASVLNALDGLPLESLWLATLARNDAPFVQLQFLDSQHRPIKTLQRNPLPPSSPLPFDSEIQRAIVHDQAIVGYVRLCLLEGFDNRDDASTRSAIVTISGGQQVAGLLLMVVAALLFLESRRLHRVETEIDRRDLQKIAPGLANCIRNSLNTMRFRLATARKRSDGALAHLQAVDGEVAHLERLIDRFLALDSSRPPVIEAHPLDSFVRQAIQRVQCRFVDKRIAFESELEANLQVQACPGALVTALEELLTNAAEACPEEGVVAVRLERVKNRARIEISDNGPGVPSDVTARLFQPFTSTDPDKPGLGLAIAKNVLEAHGGDLNLAKPSTFRMSLPLPRDVERVA